MVIRAEHRRRVLEQSVDAPVHLLEGSLVNLSKRNRLHPVLLSNPDQLGGPIVQVRELVLLDAVTGRLTASVRRKPAVLVIRKHRRLAEL